MGVRTYYVPIVEGAILLFAVLGLGTQVELPDCGKHQRLLGVARSEGPTAAGIVHSAQ